MVFFRRKLRQRVAGHFFPEVAKSVGSLDGEPALTPQVSSELFCAKYSFKEAGMFSKDR